MVYLEYVWELEISQTGWTLLTINGNLMTGNNLIDFDENKDSEYYMALPSIEMVFHKKLPGSSQID